jgi:hypothetical protein
MAFISQTQALDPRFRQTTAADLQATPFDPTKPIRLYIPKAPFPNDADVTVSLEVLGADGAPRIVSVKAKGSTFVPNIPGKRTYPSYKAFLADLTEPNVTTESNYLSGAMESIDPGMWFLFVPWDEVNHYADRISADLNTPTAIKEVLDVQQHSLLYGDRNRVYYRIELPSSGTFIDVGEAKRISAQLNGIDSPGVFSLISADGGPVLSITFTPTPQPTTWVVKQDPLPIVIPQGYGPGISPFGELGFVSLADTPIPVSTGDGFTAEDRATLKDIHDIVSVKAS